MPIPGALYESAKLLALLPASWLVPVDRLGPLAQALRRRRPARRGATDIVMAHLLADQATPEQAQEIFYRWGDRLLESTLQILALRRPGRSWRPAIGMLGREHLDAALARGAGAILWISDFIYRPLIVPMALRQAGFAQVHLSRPEHGFSVSPFAVRFLNPLWIEVENRFLAERVTITNNDAASALATLRDRLAHNAVVSITVAETGRRTLDPEFLRGRLRVASGPLHLARTAGAPILPVAALRQADGGYTVSIGEPLDTADYAAAARAYAAGLEPFVRRYPDQWSGWIALGRLVENAPAFPASFGCAAALCRDLERLGRALAAAAASTA